MTQEKYQSNPNPPHPLPIVKENLLMFEMEKAVIPIPQYNLPIGNRRNRSKGKTTSETKGSHSKSNPFSIEYFHRFKGIFMDLNRYGLTYGNFYRRMSKWAIGDFCIGGMKWEFI